MFWMVPLFYVEQLTLQNLRSDIQAAIQADGWHVVWGANIDEIEWAAFLSAVVAAVPSGGASLAAYFTEYLTTTLEKVQQQGLPIAQDVLWKLLTDAILEGPQSIELDGLEIEAAVATYMRSVNIPYPVIKAEKTIWITMPEWIKRNLGIPDIEGWKNISITCCATKKVGAPNHHQPYIRVRWKDGHDTWSDIVQSPGNRVLYRRCEFDVEATGVLYVNAGHHGRKQGTQSAPCITISDAYIAARRGTEIHIHAGSYPEKLKLDKPAVLLSEGGSVTIGR